MKEIERQFQRALGTINWYMVVLKTDRRKIDGGNTIHTQLVEAVDEQDAFKEAVQLHIKKDRTIRRDQITLHRIRKTNF